tara:strand:- start:145 stop:621 length:477 start_codon:yes stop_codon:yes gene_type:complete
LPELFWEKVMKEQGFAASKLPAPFNGIMLFAAFAAWVVLNLGVLMVMENLSSFLHALRLQVLIPLPSRAYTAYTPHHPVSLSHRCSPLSSHHRSSPLLSHASLPLLSLLSSPLLSHALASPARAAAVQWVEFQNKFYHGDGQKFAPFTFAALDQEEDD